ncbi:tRNA (adenosine(37)-N6)-threonylcarbamoyltransferase complex transferase subunit TsaD [Candidatus Woesebacteria bacterium]|nr:tRNA (adenosine(37)-N6)-threonylcarbamoyltransferase complex transferase subunit TsaD [Candidatus Woesebacteria bacterium]
MPKLKNQSQQTIPPLILAVDTSCDDTSASVMRGQTILSNVIASQTQLHKQYGGVFPTVAKQAHKENILPTISAALKKANTSLTELSALAVTVGPGLAPALEVGITTIKQLATDNCLPLIAVNHIEGHALSAIAQSKTKTESNNTAPIQHGKEIIYPVLSVVVSGGHTQFIYFEKIGEYKILGSTIDDAAGECLDKIGRMLNLGYPAGPVIEKFAKLGDPLKIEFPLPMTGIKTFDMSFSGMKTFARNYIQKNTESKSMTKQDIYDFCASAQYSVFRHITYKLSKLLIVTPINEIWLGGGVAQNISLRRTIREIAKKYSKSKNEPITFRFPHTNRLCMDNAAMIGLVANYKYERGEFVTDFETVDRKPRWEIGESL